MGWMDGWESKITETYEDCFGISLGLQLNIDMAAAGRT